MNIVESGSAKQHLTVLGGLIAVWLFLLLTISALLVSEAYWYSYYAVDYSQGFIRRGLAGEVVRLFPAEDYFTVIKTLRWVPVILLCMALSMMAYAVATKAGRSKRRILLAILTPLLPGGFAYAFLTGRTDSFGVAAMILFAIFVNACNTDRRALIGSAVFGALVAIFTLMHEGTPFLVGLGVLAALVVLGRFRSKSTLWLSASLSLGPALFTSLMIIMFGARGVSSELCAIIPHGMINIPMATNVTTYQLLTGFRYETDYHDWACRNITPFFDLTMREGAGLVADIGAGALTASTVLGLMILVLNISAVSYISGVPFRRMAELLRMRASLIVFGFALYLPIFITGTDWTRWWVMVTFNVGTVFLLFVSREPESAQPIIFERLLVAIIAILFLMAPFSAVPGFGIPYPV